ncbi:MAG: hypothetical protein WA194_01555 [Patescibacteria group bacterium]
MAINASQIPQDDEAELLAGTLNRDLLPLDAAGPESAPTEANPVVENVIGVVLGRLKKVSE